jgi:sec-independent protein translocase protein TatA
MLLSFLNLGPTEVFLVLVLFVLLFGAQKVPEMARALGRAKAEMDRAQREIKEAITPQEDRALAEQLAFERMREEHVRAQQEDPEMAALERAAGELGLVTAGMTKEQLRAAIAAKVSDGGSAGSGKGAENAAGAQQ